KALYAYFCAYAGSGYSCYPPRDKILSDLGFSVGTYYIYLRELQALGLVEVKKHRSAGQEWCNNRVVLPQQPALVMKACVKLRRKIDLSASLRDFGFGRVSLALMTDKRVSRRAKALYAYFCGFAGNKSCCTPKIENTLSFLGICVNSYYKYLNELLTYNYITILHHKDAHGRFAANSIVINEQPDHINGLAAIELRRESYRSRINGVPAVLKVRSLRKRRRMFKKPQQLLEELRKQIDFDSLAEKHPKERLNMIVGFMAELHHDPYSSVNVAAITGSDISAFIEQLQRSINPATVIKHPVSYWHSAFINHMLSIQMR
ncbi:MAG: hypothetical protein J5968_00450, partial [Oscillospiraceae bacterium]|nr:hypothetical protein [Oscillospiraceae bacterium]